MITLIGDVHGKYKDYFDIVQQHPYTLQLGDFGFNYDILDKLDTNKHRVLRGNHDNYDVSHPNLLDDFGQLTIGGLDLYYVRGGHSLDKKSRLLYQAYNNKKIWWEEEELTYSQSLKALKDYEKNKPKIVVTHTCPASISEIVGNTNILLSFGLHQDWCSNTQRLLQAMLDIHKPDLWVFGHFHRDWSAIIDGVQYQCLDELSILKVNNN